MNNLKITEKIKIEFEGWHCIPKKETKQILVEARERFKNANFIDNCGILVETVQPEKVFEFCLEILQRYKNTYLNSWDGYTIKKISKRIIYNYQDKKRKLSLEYFKKLILENTNDDINLIIAGTLYLKLNDVKKIINLIEQDLQKQLQKMNEEEIKISYNQLLKLSSSIIRTFNEGD